MFGIILVVEMEQKQEIWCLKRKSLNITLCIKLLSTVVYDCVSIRFVIMQILGENGIFRVILTI